MFDDIALNELPVSFCAKDLMQLLGISKSFAYKIINSGELKYYAIGKRKVVMREDFFTWLKNKESGLN